MWIRFFILPPANVRKRAEVLAKRFSKEFPSYFVVDDKKLFPHITLFYTNLRKIPSGNLKINFSPFKLRIDGLIVYNQGITLTLKISGSKKLNSFRKEMFHKLKRENFLNSRETLIKYYSPHITLTKYKKNRQGFQVKEKAPRVKLSFKTEYIGMGLSDKHGQVYKIIKKFKLK